MVCESDRYTRSHQRGSKTKKVKSAREGLKKKVTETTHPPKHPSLWKKIVNIKKKHWLALLKKKEKNVFMNDGLTTQVAVKSQLDKYFNCNAYQLINYNFLRKVNVAVMKVLHFSWNTLQEFKFWEITLDASSYAMTHLRAKEMYSCKFAVKSFNYTTSEAVNVHTHACIPTCKSYSALHTDMWRKEGRKETVDCIFLQCERLN